MRRISHTPQGGTTAVNAAGGTLMVDLGLAGVPIITIIVADSTAKYCLGTLALDCGL